MPVLIMLSNYFHDLAVAFLFGSFILLGIMYKVYIELNKKKEFKKFLREVYNYFSKIIIIAWSWIIIGGIIRTVNYRQYEWLPAAGRGQIGALVVKHVILVVLVVSGVYMQYKFKNKVLREE